MANPTTNFGWQMPTSSDLVTDLPADFEVFGQAVDTSLMDLKGGTTGQVLSKASNTDMDFTWTTAQVGDITAVTAGTGISGGGTSGDVTITNSMATAITTNGDLIYGTGSGTFSRLGIGSTDQVLKVTGGVPAWGTITTTAPGLSFISATSFSSATSVSVNSCFSSTYDSYKIIVTWTSGNGSTFYTRLRSSGTDATTGYVSSKIYNNSTTLTGAYNLSSSEFPIGVDNYVNGSGSFAYELLNPFLTTQTTYLPNPIQATNPGQNGINIIAGRNSNTTSYDGVSIIWTTACTGTIRIYGYRNS